MRSSFRDAVLGLGLFALGSGVLVFMATVTVAVPEASRKVAAIVLAVAAVWVLSRGGVLLYNVLLAR